MTRTILFVALWSLAATFGMAQEPAVPAEATPAAEARPSAPEAPAVKTAIVLIIDADLKQSEVVRQVIEALEKSGIAKAEAAHIAPAKQDPKSAISVALAMRADEKYDNIKQLVEALCPTPECSRWPFARWEPVFRGKRHRTSSF